MPRFCLPSLWRVQSTFRYAAAFNQPLQAWNVSRVRTLTVRAASHPLHLSPLTRMRRLAFAYYSLCRVQSAFGGAAAFNQPLEAWDVGLVGVGCGSIGVGCSAGDTGFTVRAASPPLSRITATASHRHASLLSPSSLRSAPRLPSLTRSPLPHRLTQPATANFCRHRSERLQQGPDCLRLVGQPAVVELILFVVEPEPRRRLPVAAASLVLRCVPPTSGASRTKKRFLLV